MVLVDFAMMKMMHEADLRWTHPHADQPLTPLVVQIDDMIAASDQIWPPTVCSTLRWEACVELLESAPLPVQADHHDDRRQETQDEQDQRSCPTVTAISTAIDDAG